MRNIENILENNKSGVRRLKQREWYQFSYVILLILAYSF